MTDIHATNPLPSSEPSRITRCMCSGHVTSSSNIRTYVLNLDGVHAGDTHQTPSTQTPSVSQRTRTFAPNHHHHHPTNVHSFPPSTNHPTCTLQNTTQRPINHRVNSISRLLQHAPLHRPYITPSPRTFGSYKACHLIKTLNNGQIATNSHTQSS